MATIICRELQRDFGRIQALNNVSLCLSGPKIIGLIGKNGAGKTTLLKTIAGLLKPTGGSITIGDQIPGDNLRVLSEMILARDELVFDENYTPEILFDIASRYYSGWDNDYAVDLAARFGLDLTKKIRKMSKGMKTGLSIVIAFASSVDVTMFDEPTEGLDAANRKLFYRLLIKEASKESRTFILSSHLLSELDTLLEEIVLIDEGRILLHESMDNIRGWCMELEGHRELIDSFTKGKTVYHRLEIGEKSRVVLKENDIKEEERIHLESSGIKTYPVSPQDTCIYLTQQEVFS